MRRLIQHTLLPALALSLVVGTIGCMEEDFKFDSISPKNGAKDVPLNVVIAVKFVGKEHLAKNQDHAANFQLARITEAEKPKEDSTKSTSAADADQNNPDEKKSGGPQFKETAVNCVPRTDRIPQADSNGQLVTMVYCAIKPPAEAIAPLEENANYQFTINAKSESGVVVNEVSTFTTAKSNDFAFDGNEELEVSNGSAQIEPSAITEDQVIDPKTYFLAEFGAAVNPSSLLAESYVQQHENVSEKELREIAGMSTTTEQDLSKEETIDATIEELVEELYDLEDRLAALNAAGDEMCDETEAEKELEERTAPCLTKKEKREKRGLPRKITKKEEKIDREERRKDALDNQTLTGSRTGRRGISDDKEKLEFWLAVQVEPDSDGFIRCPYDTVFFKKSGLRNGGHYDGMLAYDGISIELDFYVLKGRGHSQEAGTSIQEWNEQLLERLSTEKYKLFRMKSGNSKTKDPD